MLRTKFSILQLALVAAFAGGVVVTTASSATAGASRTAAGNTRILLFDLPAAGAYDIRVNGNTTGTANAGPAGSVSFESSTVAGDLVQFSLNGIEPVTPAAPAGFVATGNTQGCISMTWNTPPPSDYVTGYMLLWGSTAGVYTDSVAVSRLEEIRAGGTSQATRCGFPTGTFHFVLRAHNSFGLWSARSNPSTANVSNENTQGPPAPTNVTASENPAGCMRVAWSASGDPTVAGYRLYLGTSSRSRGAYGDSLDVGLTTNGSFCALPAGTYYAAVRARTTMGMLSAFSKETALVVVGPDLTPPVVTAATPPDGAANVARNATVFFVVSDARSGVNRSSITVRVAGQLCAVVVTPAPQGYAVQCRPDALLPAQTDILVEVSASDGATPANNLNASWTFRTGLDAVNDIDPPVISSPSPAPNSTNVSPAATISVSVADAGLGVDLGSVAMIVNGARVTFVADGTPENVRISWKPEAGFEPGTTVQVSVEACDRAGPSNCASPLSFSFAVGNLQLATEPGAIVPDGFWADDPNRPMEVRDLPASWRVRIFDTAGVQVRHFTNSQPGQTWTWDFRNDRGERVAPALYLVRVTDESGAVRESARFLVQSQ